MFNRLDYYIFSTLIIFIFTFTHVSAATCDFSQKSCYSTSYPYSWCCQYSEYCGDVYTPCLTYTTTTSSSPSDFTPGVSTAIVCVAFFFCVLCISCCIRSQQQQQRRIRSSVINANARVTPQPYQQQPARRPPRVVHVRPVNNVSAAPSIHFMHEEPPPSYEVATRNVPPTYPSAPPQSPPVTATYDQPNFRV